MAGFAEPLNEHYGHPSAVYPNGQFNNQENVQNTPPYFQNNQHQNFPHFPSPFAYQMPFMANGHGQYQNMYPNYQWNQNPFNQYQMGEAPSYNQNLGSYINVTLENATQWRKFHELGNEMMVVNSGRALFPKLAFAVQNAKPSSQYKASLKLRRLYNHSFEFKNGNWNPKDNCLDEWPVETNEVFTKELKTGKQLMKDGIDFKSIKIFNVGNEKKKKVKRNELTEEQMKEVAEKEKEMMQVLSDCNYMPVVTLYEVPDGSQIQQIGTFSFPETAFMAVTAYKKKELKLLKCSENQYTKKTVKEAARKKLFDITATPSGYHGAPQTPPTHNAGPSTSFDSNTTTSSTSSSFSSSPALSSPGPMMQNQVQQFPDFQNANFNPFF